MSFLLAGKVVCVCGGGVGGRCLCSLSGDLLSGLVGRDAYFFVL